MQQATGVVKDAESCVLQLDRLYANGVAMQTGAANGASVVFSLYTKVGGSWFGPIEMQAPKDVDTPVTTLTGVDKQAVVPAAWLNGVTAVWARRTDADASTDATVYLNAVRT